MSAAVALPDDPASLLRSRQYRVLLVFASVVGLVVSACCWGFLELVHVIEVGVYTDLPHHLDYKVAPEWWPLPWLALAGLLTAFAIVRLPGHGGHVPADGLKAGGTPTQPIELPGAPRRDCHARPRARARARGTPTRRRDGPGNTGDAARQEGRAPAGARVDGRGRKLLPLSRPSSALRQSAQS